MANGPSNAGLEGVSQAWVASLGRQAAFARGYSPLYAAILDALAGWLAGGAAGAGVRRRFLAFATAQAWENDLEPILKLAAALHSYVLAGDPRVAGLRRYYSTVGAAQPVGDGFAGDLLRALDGLGDELVATARGWRIQTNETARGVVWLVPAAVLQVEAAHLVELGCSAGLNLFADQRRYDLRWADGSGVTLGQAEAAQFEVACAGPGFEATLRAPEVLSRVGIDVQAVDLDAPGAEAQLAACVWGDQPQRLARLREGLALRRRFNDGTAQAARLVRGTLPEELEEFLAGAVPVQPLAPVILFDTFMTAYFNDVDHGALVRGVEAFARPWTLRHRMPWLWVRFEPPRAGMSAPEVGWCRWWVEAWTQGRRRTIELGWAHPHCVRAVFGAGLGELAALRGPE